MNTVHDVRDGHSGHCHVTGPGSARRLISYHYGHLFGRVRGVHLQVTAGSACVLLEGSQDWGMYRIETSNLGVLNLTKDT